MIFSVIANDILIEDIFSGYPRESLVPSRAEYILDFSAHYDFYQTTEF
jgi:hypothetical protein